MAPDVNVNITTAGDATGGDKVSTGDIAGDGIAVGRSASANVAGYVSDLLADIMRRLNDMERRLLQIEVRDEYARQREQHDRASISGGWIVFAGLAISVVLISLMLWLATSGYHVSP